MKLAFKFVKIGGGIVLLALLGFVAWIWVSLFSGPSAMEINAYHPFKTPEAKARYLTRYAERSLEWPIPYRDRMVKTVEGQTFVRISGPKNGPPLILMPSASGTTLMWLPNIEALARDFRVYAVDNIYDFGRSIYAREFETPRDFTTWMDNLFRGLGLKNGINLMGLSYGGWLTAQYALHHPEKLEKIVLLAPVATVAQLPGEWAWRALKAMIPHRRYLQDLLEWMFPELIKTEHGRRIANDLLEDAYLGLRSFKTKMTVTPTVLTDEEWADLKTPTLFMVGEKEVLYPARTALKRLNTVAPEIKTTLIPNAGHDLTIAQAALINKNVVTFLKPEAGKNDN